MKDWKSTSQPILTVALVVGPLLLTDGSPIHSKTAIWSIGSLVAAAKVWIGILEKDAGTTEAVLPSGEVKAVDSHEIPNDPKATPVTEVK